MPCPLVCAKSATTSVGGLGRCRSLRCFGGFVASARTAGATRVTSGCPSATGRDSPPLFELL